MFEKMGGFQVQAFTLQASGVGGGGGGPHSDEKSTFHQLIHGFLPRAVSTKQKRPEVQRWHLPWRSRGAASWLSAPRRRPDGALVLSASPDITTNKADVQKIQNIQKMLSEIE